MGKATDNQTVENKDQFLINSPSSFTLQLNGLLPTYNTIDNIEDNSQKMKLFGNFAHILKHIKPTSTLENDKEVALLCQQLTAKCLYNQGMILANITTQKDILNPSDIKELQKAIALVAGSLIIFQELCEVPTYQAEDFNALVQTTVIKASQMEEEETDLQKSLDLFNDSISIIHQNITILSTTERETLLPHILRVSLIRTIKAHDSTFREAKEVYNNPHKSQDRYKKLRTLKETVCQILNFTETHLLPIKFKLIAPSEVLPSYIEKNKKIPQKASTFLPNRPILSPQDFKMLIATLYCGLLKEASLTLHSFAMSSPSQSLKDLYLQKSKSELTIAIHLFKKDIYQQDYKNKAELEQQYILAFLADLTCNPLPLKEFYRQLHKQHRDERHQRHILKIKEQQAKKEQLLKTQEAQKEKLQLPRETRIAEEHSSSIAGQTNDPYPSSTGVVPKSTYKLMETKQKVKTWGIANPPSLAQATLPTIPKEMLTQKIKLSKEDYTVLEGLTGGHMNRNIPLKAVEKLLSSLQCTLTTESKGTHQKATAPNGQIWTRPKPWKGPIPDYYRLQLNDFLQNRMGIDPALVYTDK